MQTRQRSGYPHHPAGNRIILQAVHTISSLPTIMRSLVLSFVLLSTLAATGRAELTPDEVVILAVRDSPESRELAEYYAAAREIPTSHICLLECAAGGELSRAEWDASVRPFIRRWLGEQGLLRRVRCLVTTWDVPLAIGRASPESLDVDARRTQMQAERQDRLARLADVLHEVESLLADQPPPREDFDAAMTAEQIGERFEKAFKDAAARVREKQETEDGRAAAAKVEQLALRYGGRLAFLQSAARRGADELSPEAKSRFDTLRGELQGLQQGLLALGMLPETAARDAQALGILFEIGGLFGSLKSIDEQAGLLDRDESYASFDSELSLLHWDRYCLTRWLPNSLHYAFDGAADKHLPRTLMVARLEAPTLDLAKKIVDDALLGERDGLSGKFYIDARGIHDPPQVRQQGSYGDYDEALRNLAALLKQYTKLEVVLDDRGELFQAGECPDAALYCGWYSLSNYVDAFEWQPGAVAYHIASGEAATLRDAASNVWCKRMLEDGVAATLGPVFEPYLMAFPRPDEFYCMLLSGRHTLAECYYRTLMWNSWVMTLVGDPLYNPYRGRPALDLDGLPPNVQRVIEGPNERTASDR